MQLHPAQHTQLISATAAILEIERDWLIYIISSLIWPKETPINFIPGHMCVQSDLYQPF